MHGSRGAASRLGTAKSGLTVTCNGWDIGATCYVQAVDVSSDADTVSIYLTTGSNGGGRDIFLGKGTLDGEGRLRWTPGSQKYE